jgi:hypothetical protein
MVQAEETSSIGDVVKMVSQRKMINFYNSNYFISIPDGNKTNVFDDQILANFKTIEMLIIGVRRI